jgi:hypothetical protein
MCVMDLFINKRKRSRIRNYRNIIQPIKLQFIACSDSEPLQKPQTASIKRCVTSSTNFASSSSHHVWPKCTSHRNAPCLRKGWYGNYYQRCLQAVRLVFFFFFFLFESNPSNPRSFLVIQQKMKKIRHCVHWYHQANHRLQESFPCRAQKARRSKQRRCCHHPQ